MSQCFENFSMFDFCITPIGQPTDQMKPLIQTSTTKECPKQCFDVILNKFLNNHELNDIQLQQLSEEERLILEETNKKSNKKPKRSDEYQKVFYKRVFKYAIKKYFKKDKKKKNRRISYFYHHHFDAVAEKMNIPIVNFYHPDKKTRPGFQTGQKSFNSSYIKLILKSQSFKDISKQYHLIFKHQCFVERQKKITKYTKYTMNLIDKYKHQSAKLMECLGSNKSKIPWTNRDIEEAALRAAKDLYEEYEDEVEEQIEEEQVDNNGQQSSISMESD